MSRQTIVLLKNEDVLPVREKKLILVIGELADDKEALTGPWAFTGDSGKTVTIVEGLRKKGVDVAVCGLPSHAMKMMQRTDLKQIIGDENFYWSVERVLLSNRPRPEQP